MNPQPPRNHRKGVVTGAIAATLAIIIVALTACWQLSQFPARHRMHADVITQTKALLGSDADHVQQAIDRSGKTNIQMLPSDDVGDNGIFYIYVKRTTLLFRIRRPRGIYGTDGKLGLPIDVMPDNASAEKQLKSSSSNYAATVIFSNGTSTVTHCDPKDDSKDGKCFTVPENDTKLEKTAEQAVWEVIDIVADNW